MNKEFENNLYYICSMIEYIGRKTHNKVKDVLSYINKKDIKHELDVASVNHCLSFEQVSDEWIEKYKIKNGTFDNMTTCKFEIPSYTSIGKVYLELILSVSNKDNIIENIYNVYNSFISDAISNFNSSMYYSNPSYILNSYLKGELLD